jgi:hypothetical protein
MDAPSAPPRALGRGAVDMLAGIPLFSELSRRSIAKVASCASTKRFASGAPLVRVGEPKIALAIMATLTGRLRALQAATL